MTEDADLSGEEQRELAQVLSLIPTFATAVQIHIADEFVRLTFLDSLGKVGAPRVAVAMPISIAPRLIEALNKAMEEHKAKQEAERQKSNV